MIFCNIAVHWHTIYALYVEAVVKYTALSVEQADSVFDEKSCYLGRWICDADAALAARPELLKLRSAHDRFHASANDCIQAANAKSPDHGRLDKWIARLHAASEEVTEAIEELDAVFSGQPRRAPAKVVPDCPVHLHRVGVTVIDRQHQALAAIAQCLTENPAGRLAEEVNARLLAELVSLTDLHFRTEELYMRSIQLPAGELQRHVAEHQRILRNLRTLSDNTHAMQMTVADVLPQMTRWFSDHLIDYDYSLKKF